MKVKIAFSVDVIPEAWADEFHVALEDVRDDVKDSLQDHCREYLSTIGVVPIRESFANTNRKVVTS
jgi:hypothetical protein